MILVTGGTGLVGSHLLYQLTLAEDCIRAIHRKNSDLDAVKRVFSYYNSDIENQFKKIEWLEADICDTPSLDKVFKGISKVYHCAALVSFNKADYQEMRHINIEGTANMVNFSLSNMVEKFCFVSSIATIEKNTSNKLIDETNEWNTETNNYGYAITKYGAEMEVWRGSQEGLNVVMVNPGVILGSGFWHNGPGELFSKVYKGFKFYTEGITGFVGVKDVAKIMVQLMQSKIKNERFILVSENKSFKDVFFNIADSFGKKRPSIKVSKFLSGLAWRLEWLKSLITRKAPLITKHSASASLSVYQYSSEKVEKILGYQFESLNETIESVCQDFVKK
jgi:nucleoside-diphosphate-sugar epimerase